MYTIMHLSLCVVAMLVTGKLWECVFSCFGKLALLIKYVCTYVPFGIARYDFL